MFNISKTFKARNERCDSTLVLEPSRVDVGETRTVREQVQLSLTRFFTDRSIGSRRLVSNPSFGRGLCSTWHKVGRESSPSSLLAYPLGYSRMPQSYCLWEPFLHAREGIQYEVPLLREHVSLCLGPSFPMYDNLGEMEQSHERTFHPVR